MRSSLLSGWTVAVRRALLALAVVGAVAEVAPFLAYAGGSHRPSALATARLGGVLFFAFHRVALVFHVSELAGGGAGGQAPFVPEGGRLVLSLALMSGTVLAVWLLWLGGRAVARREAAPGWNGGLQGAKVALPYAVACLVASYGIDLSGEVPFAGGTVPGLARIRFDAHVGHLAALLWPLGIALVAGFAGGFSIAGRDRPSVRAERWARGALAGAGRMLWFGLAFAVAALLGMAAVNPHATAVYVRGAFRPGATTGLALIGLNGLALANMAAWVLYPAMGSCVELSAGGRSVCVLSYSHLPPAGSAVLGSGSALPRYPAAPGPYLLFLAVPALAVVLGGAAAARRSNPGTAVGRALAGALAGVLFGALSIGVLVLSGVELASGGTAGTITLGPNPLVAAGLAAAWGIAGGALGGLVSRPLAPDGAAEGSGSDSEAPGSPEGPG